MTNQYFLARIAGWDPNLRAADADRERVAERLRKGHTEGRLDMAEFQQRLERCYESKTVGELGELVRDLPRPDEYEQRRPFSWGSPYGWSASRFVPILIALLVVLAATGHHVFWLWIPILFIVWRVSWRRRRWSGGSRRGPGLWT